MGRLFRRGRRDAQERGVCAICGKEHPLATMVTGHKDPEDIPAGARGEVPPPGDWWLEDAEAAHEQAPRSFFIPPAHRRRALRPGELVRLGFNCGPHGDREGEGHRERMWVEVLERGDDGRTPDFVIRAPGPYTADQDEWWLLCRAGASGPTTVGVGRLTDLFPGLEEPLRAGAGVWELAAGERASASWRRVPDHEFGASDAWQDVLRGLEQTAQAMRTGGSAPE